MKLALLCLVAVAIAQYTIPIYIDAIHEYRVMYDDEHNLILLIGDTDCYLTDAGDRTWDQIVTNENELHQTVEDIYNQIQDGRGISSMTQEQATAQYHSRLEQWQCDNHRIHRVRFSP